MNVVLIVLDTVRKDYFDEHATQLSEMATSSFDRCYAPSSWSIPSHASIFTGKLPHQHGVHSYNPDYSDLDGPFLDELPHRTIGVSANGTVSETFGIEALFDEFHSFAGNDERSADAVSFGEVADESGLDRYVSYLLTAYDRGKLIQSLSNGMYIKVNEFLSGKPVPKFGDFGAEAVIEKSMSMIGTEPFFLFLNFIDAHGPMENLRRFESDVPYRWSSHELDFQTVRDRSRDEIETYLERYRDLYAASIRYLDRKVASMIERTQTRTTEPTTFIITADHGEELRFPGEADLGHMDFSTGVLHVPFVVVGPEGNDSDALTSLLDIGPLIESVVSGNGIPDIERERVPAERPGMMFYSGEDDYWTRGVRTVYQDDVRYEWDTDGRKMRYPVETSRDGEPKEVEIPAEMYDIFDIDLDEFVDRAVVDDRSVEVDAETSRQLEDLGYKI